MEKEFGDKNNLACKVLNWVKQDSLWKLGLVTGLSLFSGLVNLQVQLSRETSYFRNYVVNQVDKNSNGLSFREEYKIRELMGVQDKPLNYGPTLDDWKVAYTKLILDE